MKTREKGSFWETDGSVDVIYNPPKVKRGEPIILQPGCIYVLEVDAVLNRESRERLENILMDYNIRFLVLDRGIKLMKRPYEDTDSM